MKVLLSVICLLSWKTKINKEVAMSKKELIVPLFLFGCVAVLFSMPDDSFGQSPADCQAYTLFLFPTLL